MIKSLIIGSAAASYCGCDKCSVDWLEGSQDVQDYVSKLVCFEFMQLMLIGAKPEVEIADGTPCIDVLQGV